MNRKSEELKEKQISEVMLSIENRVRYAYNQGYEQGLKDSKQDPCEQIKWERDTAIKQLNELGYGFGEKIEPCEDCVSRQAVLDKLNRLIEVERLQGSDEMGYGRERVSAYECMIEAVESEYLYPSVQPKPKTGHWIEEHNGWVRCSCCSDHYPQTSYGAIGTKFCPHCGAKMESEDKQ